MQRHEREELLDCPGVGGRAENRKVGVIGASQDGWQGLQFVWHDAVVREPLHQGCGAGPGELFSPAAVGEAEVAEPECGKCVVFEFERIVPCFLQAGHIGTAEGVDALQGVAQVAHNQRFVVSTWGVARGRPPVPRTLNTRTEK